MGGTYKLLRFSLSSTLQQRHNSRSKLLQPHQYNSRVRASRVLMFDLKKKTVGSYHVHGTQAVVGITIYYIDLYRKVRPWHEAGTD